MFKAWAGLGVLDLRFVRDGDWTGSRASLGVGGVSLRQAFGNVLQDETFLGVSPGDRREE